MNKNSSLKQIQKRLPEDIIIEDVTTFEFTDDEIIGILSWVKYFNKHYIQHGKDKNPTVIIPLISKRLRLNFGLYRFPSDVESNRGKHVIYILQNDKLPNGVFKKNLSVKDLINTWGL